MLFLTILVMNQFLPASKSVTRHDVGHDFIAFYTAGHFIAQGHPELVYDLDAVHAYQREQSDRYHLDMGNAYGPFWNPPFYALVFVPLAKLPFPEALAIWEALQITCFIIACVLLIKLMKLSAARNGGAATWREWALIPGFLCVSMPLVQALSHGQNSCSSLLLLSATALLWHQRQALWAGIVCGLMFYKPQLGAVMAGVLVLSQGWRALLGLAITGAALLLINQVALAGLAVEYIQRMPHNLHVFQVDNVYIWERHITFKAFWRLLLMGRAAGPASETVNLLTVSCAVALGGALSAVAWRKRRVLPPDRLIAAAVATMPLLMPFYFDYDLLMLAIPLTLFAASRIGRDPALPLPARDAWLGRAWMVLFGWMTVNNFIGGHAHFNGAVPLLTLISILLISRASASPSPAVESRPDALPELAAQFA